MGCCYWSWGGGRCLLGVGKEGEKRKIGDFGLQLLATARVGIILVDENNYVMTCKKREIRILMEKVVSIVCHLLPSLFLEQTIPLKSLRSLGTSHLYKAR